MINSLARLNTLSSTELSDALDALGIEGALLGIKPLTMGTKLMGPAFTIKYQLYDKKPASFKPAGDYIDNVPAGSVIVIDNQGLEDCTVWGDILTQVAVMKEIAGTVVHGAVRDVQLIREQNYPLCCRSIYMRTGRNRVYKSDEQVELTINQISIHPGDIMFADDNGVLVIPVALLDDVIEKATAIRQTENNIVASVRAGSTLKAARETYNYKMPWMTPP